LPDFLFFLSYIHITAFPNRRAKGVVARVNNLGVVLKILFGGGDFAKGVARKRVFGQRYFTQPAHRHYAEHWQRLESVIGEVEGLQTRQAAHYPRRKSGDLTSREHQRSQTGRRQPRRVALKIVLLQE